jgi:hypothetical protein
VFAVPLVCALLLPPLLALLLLPRLLLPPLVLPPLLLPPLLLPPLGIISCKTNPWSSPLHNTPPYKDLTS